MMRFRLALRDQPFTNSDGERKVGEPAAVQVPELAPADAEFDTAEPVRRDGDTGPAGDFPLDQGTNRFRHST